jgi:hypothetical protein
VVVVALLPAVDLQAHYRVKSLADGHLRALLEAQITPLKPPGSRQNSPK